ncbi:ERG4/ERG24 ergosterol biosynthesis protein [Cylindrobasidium torrendii FP15055 ss-10]|uniref:Delta(14)-sterol reductase ERG24 n=1 Tax=Cylindrobasidium torrendii FP15055 ss-10 TaxID=1314674 RepID=A0A0D7BBE6_9AGAR|nr:ERG4/ERG24 ergosterol biosynthesis protein [Cylindrobasidium torrendii FP15055 ss-10]
MGTPAGTDLNPRTTKYEFYGPPGALFVTVATPFFTYLLYFSCSEETGGCPPEVDLEHVLGALKDPHFYLNLWDAEAAKWYFAWFAFCVAAWAILPARVVEGTLMRDGLKKKYKTNAFSTCILAFCIVAGIIYQQGPEGFTILYRKLLGFMTAALAVSTVQAVHVYASSFQPGKLLTLNGNTGNPIYDFFIGRELNPTIGSLDLKYFNELRPGLILWALICISTLCEQATRRGGWANVTDSMWLTAFFQIFYVVDSMYNEAAIFTIMDITTDGFGFMLSFGDLVWVPFTYSLQARYLVFEQVELGLVYTALILGLNSLGYLIFRQANSEKNDFRNGKNPRNLAYLTTKRGSKLLTSGWWGRSRHPNYFGDLLMALAWSLPTGFETPITYFYVIFFTFFLIYRQERDDAACAEKYGDDWETYKQIVPYRIVPYVY